MPDLTPDADAAQMVEALRSGAALRRGLEKSGPHADGARLAALGDLEGLPPLAKPGAAAPAIRFARRVLQVFLRPWLAAQTIFNRELAHRFDDSVTVVRDLRRRVPLIEESLQALDDRLRQVEGQRRLPSETPLVADGTYLQRLFVHSRLPPPPARVRLVGEVDEGLRGELATLGYTVVSSVGDAEQADAVVALVASDGRVLRPGIIPTESLAPRGRAVMIVTCSDERAPPREAIAAALPSLVVSEIQFLGSGAAGWQLTGSPDNGARAVLVCARRPDASAG